jgi:hypothetical protein
MGRVADQYPKDTSTKGQLKLKKIRMASVGSANNNKRWLTEMQRPEKYKEKFDVGYYLPEEGPSLETSKISLYFSGSCIPAHRSFIKKTRTYWRLCNLQVMVVSVYVCMMKQNKQTTQPREARGTRTWET